MLSGDDYDVTICLEHEIDLSFCHHKELQTKARVGESPSLYDDDY